MARMNQMVEHYGTQLYGHRESLIEEEEERTAATGETTQCLRNVTEDDFPKGTLQIHGPSNNRVNGDKISHGHGFYTANIEKEKILSSASGSGPDDSDHEETSENTAEVIITV